MGTIVKLNTIQEYNMVMGVETLHPLVSVVDFSTLKSLKHGRKNFGFYCIFLKQLKCGELSYGRSTYDYQEGTLVFVAPGQVAGVDDDKETLNPQGWALLFHPDLLRGTSLGRKMKDYSFFSYEANEALHMSERERQIILNCYLEIQEELEAHGVTVENLNFGGGLGIDYYHPNHLSIPAFDNYFAAIHKLLQVRPGQQVHFEPGRSIVAQCGTLISKVLYVKEGETKKFAILDAGFTELIRPAMYDAYHRIENISSDEAVETYDVVGPICESSDVFGKDVELNKAHRGDLIALRSAGAYGEVMASQYNCRHLPKAYYSDTIK